MASLDDPRVRRLLDHKNHAVLSTVADDGTIHSTVVWIDVLDGRPAVNGAVGRKWPANLEREPRTTVVVYDEANPYEYVEIRGRATGTTDGADAHIDRLAKVYLGLDAYPYRTEGEQRITYVIEPDVVRHQQQ